mmetsp:Transcript_4415/g.591  ORF Transcript_4415/g.591 Transcript_4415/m.591 type:complete len:97 (+) Transcript_4415:442-732(+)
MDLNYQDDITGENCALIAVKTADLNLIKFLYKKTNANFEALNKRNEGALQIAAVWSKKLIHLPYEEVIKYLIEEIGLDPCYCHEETLLICENSKII